MWKTLQVMFIFRSFLLTGLLVLFVFCFLLFLEFYYYLGNDIKPSASVSVISATVPNLLLSHIFSALSDVHKRSFIKLIHCGIAQSITWAVVLDCFDVYQHFLPKWPLRSENEIQWLIGHRDLSIHMYTQSTLVSPELCISLHCCTVTNKSGILFPLERSVASSTYLYSCCYNAVDKVVFVSLYSAVLP